MKINGIAHVQLSVRHFEACRDFYRKLFDYLEMRIVFDEDDAIYGVGGRTGVAITRCAPERRHEPFDPERPGLHHLCFRMRSREDVDAMHAFAEGLGARIAYPPSDGPWAPGYYSCSFFDPDGIRLEANHVPGKGNLDPSVELPRKIRRDSD